MEDAQMRHGRKSGSVLLDGYKRHVLRDLDTGLIVAVGITPANAPEASVTAGIAADLDAAGRHLAELHIERLPVLQPGFRARNGRSVSIHPDEALLAELREQQATPTGRAELRERTKVEHALAHVGHWQGRRDRYTARTSSTSAGSP